MDEAVGKEPRSLMERDSAILRMIYTFEAMWKACQQLLAEREDTEVASPEHLDPHCTPARLAF